MHRFLEQAKEKMLARKAEHVDEVITIPIDKRHERIKYCRILDGFANNGKYFFIVGFCPVCKHGYYADRVSYGQREDLLVVKKEQFEALGQGLPATCPLKD